MAWKEFEMRSMTDRDGVVLCYYWVDNLQNRISRWWWPTEADALEAFCDGIEWEPR